TVLFSGKPADGYMFRGRYPKNSSTFYLDSFQFRKGSTTLDGSITFAPGEHTEGKVKGTLDLSSLAYFPMFFRDCRCLCLLDLGFSGTLKEPSLRGRVDFPDASNNEIVFRGFPHEFTSLTGSLILEGQTVVPRLTGLLGDGHFHLEGKIVTKQ